MALINNKFKDLSDSEIEFYSRQIVLTDIGYNGQLILKNKKVCVVGLGGLGSPISIQLAAMGIGYLRLVDYDIVELSNLQRQHLYGINYIGYPKVEVATKRLLELNPNIEIDPQPLSLNISNVNDILKGVDLVVDGLDNMTTRYIVNRACIKLGIPYIFGGAITTYGNVSTIIPGKTPCLECICGKLEDEMLPTCATVGVHPSILSIIASIEVSEAIRILLGREPQLTNKLFYCDIDNMKFNYVEVSKFNSCPICDSNKNEPITPIEHRFINEVCGRDGKRVFTIIPKENLNLDIYKLYTFLINNNFKIRVKADLGITFDTDLIGISILKSGIMIIKGAKNEEEAYDHYKNIINEGLKISKSHII